MVANSFRVCRSSSSFLSLLFSIRIPIAIRMDDKILQGNIAIQRQPVSLVLHQVVKNIYYTKNNIRNKNSRSHYCLTYAFWIRNNKRTYLIKNEKLSATTRAISGPNIILIALTLNPKTTKIIASKARKI